jgi:hypothetical protein
MIEQGQKVYNAIFKRIWRAMKEEFKKLYLLNGRYLPTEGVVWGGGLTNISKGDFLGDPSSIIPVADPNILSDQARVMQASTLMALAKENPAYDQDVVNITLLRALKVSNIEQVYKGIKNAPPPPPDVKIQVEQLKLQVHMANLQWKKQQFIASLMEQRRLNEAKIVEMYAQAALLMEEAGGVQTGHQISAFQSIIDLLKVSNEQLGQQIQQQQAGEEGNEPSSDGSQAGGPEPAPGGGVPPMAGGPGNGAPVQVPPG